MADIPWRNLASDVGMALSRSKDPVTFLIGAGCSVTSGCPSTPRVDSEIGTATQGRLQGQHRNRFHEIATGERPKIIQPLFADAKPYIGYYSLVALARDRAVVVLNLNWDPMVSEACKHLDIPCTTFDIQNPPVDFDLATAVQKPGVICIHLHGSTENDPRFGTLQTLRFTDSEQHLLKAAAAYETVVVGTTLVGDLDMTELLLKFSGKRPSDAAIFQFNRGSGGQTAPGYVGSEALTSRSSPLETAHGFAAGSGPDMDFDELMVRILSQVRGKKFGESSQVWADLPAFDDFIWPSRDLLSNCLPPKQLVVMTGEPQLGKSTAAHFVLHLYALWRKPGEDKTRSFDQPHDTMAAIATGDGADDIYLLEDPFGPTNTFEANPGFIKQLGNFATEAPNSSVIVTSRLSNWNTAIENEPGAPKSLPSAAAQWYDKATLKSAAARAQPNDSSVNVWIDQGEIDTPTRLKLALRGEIQLAKAQSQMEVIEEKVKLLRQHDPVAKLCILARLQEWAGVRYLKAELVAMAKVPANLGHTADNFLKDVVFENMKGVVLRHSTDQEAVDAYLAENFDRIRAEFEAERTRYPAELADALTFSHVLAALKKGDTSVFRQLDVEQIQRRCAALFAAHPTLQTLEAIGIERLDPWATVELAYEVVRLCRVLQQQGVGQTILERFAKHGPGRGTYALVEASLYLGTSVSQQVCGAIQSGLWHLLEKSDDGAMREALLIIDAFAWRPMAAEYREWVDAFTARHKRLPLWTGFLRFCETYHPDGLKDVIGSAEVGVGALSKEEAEAVAWLVRWHFVHQAHSRMLLSRSRILDKNFLCRSLHAQASSSNSCSTALSNLIDRLAEHDHLRGGAFLLYCNATAMGLQVAGSTAQNLKQMLGKMPKKDREVTLAALTYASATWREVQSYLREQDSRDFALDILRDGIDLDEGAIRPPRFTFVRDPAVLDRDFMVQWTELRHRGIDTKDVKTLAAGLRAAAEGLVAARKISSDMASRVIERVSRGDLREIETAAVARQSAPDVFEHIMLAAVELRVNSQGRLF